MKPYVGLFLLAVLLMLVTSGLRMVIPWLTGFIVDTVFEKREFAFLPLMALSIVGVRAVQGLAAFGQRYTMEVVSQRVIFDIRNTMYKHLQRLSFSFYDKAQTGQLMSRTTSDVETLRRFLGFGALELCSNCVIFFGVLIYMLLVNWKLTLVALVPMPLLLWAVRQFATKVRPRYRRIRAQLAELTTILQESISGIKVVRAFAQEEQEIKKFHNENWSFLNKNIEAVRMWAFYFPLMSLCSGLSTVAIIWYGGRLVIAGEISLGTLVAFHQYLGMLIGPIRRLGWLVDLVTRAQASGQRIFEVLDTEPEIKDKPGAIELKDVKGYVNFENVSFAYDGKNKVLENINIQAEPGQTIALLGFTGSGKSTIINLIPRFYDPDEGRITIDGIDIRDVTLKSLRSNIGTVSQETFLFSATIAENIAFGKDNASREEIIAAAKAARAHDFIMAMPKGYDTKIGERGLGLSGGQKQRLAIARALLTDPRILILDDSTSSVDTETEYLIQQALQELMKNRTTFVIAQRLSTVKNADQIIVLDEGRVVQRGTHEELLQDEEGIYRQIYDMQFKQQELAIIGARESAVGAEGSEN